MYSKTTDLEQLDWLESVEDGSLTLQAERLLFATPPEAVPAFTTLYIPDLINMAVGTRDISTVLTSKHQLLELADRFEALTHNSECYGLNDSQQIETIQDELTRFSAWLKQAAQIPKDIAALNCNVFASSGGHNAVA